MACPYCQSEATPQKLGFTWWGGLLGPKLLSHVKCPACGKGYNGKTGQPNTTNIIIYTVVIMIVVGGLLFALSAK